MNIFPRLSCAVVLLFVATSAPAQDKTVSRFIEFRDGTVMQLPVVNQPWKVTLILPTGQTKIAALLPGQVQDVTLTATHDFDKKRQLLSYVLQLGADDFGEREDAWRKILKLGPEVCPDLKACIPLTLDVEIRARLYSLINKLYPGDPALLESRIVFDRFELKDSFWGYLEDSPIVVLVQGKQQPLSRKDVARVSAHAPGSRVNVQRITAKDFPPTCVEEGFQTNPVSGQPLKAGDNVEKLFVGKGFVLSTNMPKSFIEANTFAVGGKSGGLSIANHEPQWEGETTIRFVQPGKEHIPAAVDYFGCYIAAVQPNGTYLVAYDLQDRELGKIITEQEGTEFLAVHSAVPIHKIRIVPTKLDPNYTLDDFIFHFAPTVQASHPDKVLVELAAGDSILCNDVTLQADQLVLHGLTAGLPDLTVPLANLARVNPAQTPKVQKHEGLFAELADGSIIFAGEQAEKRKMPIFTRYPDLLKNHKDVVGIWTTKSGRKLYTPKANMMALLDVESQQWQEVGYLRFLEEVVLWKKTDGQFGAAGYPQFSTIWFAPPHAKPEPGSWHVQTVAGEDLVLTKNTPLSGQLSKGVTVNWRGQPLLLPPAQIMSIYQVPAKK